MKSFDQVLIPALRRSYQNRSEVLFFLGVIRMLAKFGPLFDEATPLVHFPKALKRPRKNTGPASHYYDSKHFLALTPAGAESKRCSQKLLQESVILMS